MERKTSMVGLFLISLHSVVAIPPSPAKFRFYHRLHLYTHIVDHIYVKSDLRKIQLTTNLPERNYCVTSGSVCIVTTCRVLDPADAKQRDY